jgi:hypothetical protein
MRDPVLLPTSGNIVDRATITQHLLNDETGISLWQYFYMLYCNPYIYIYYGVYRSIQ